MLNINNLTFQLDGLIIKKLKTQQTQQFTIPYFTSKLSIQCISKSLKRNYIEIKVNLSFTNIIFKSQDPFNHILHSMLKKTSNY